MDDSENFSRYQPKAFGVNNEQGYGSSIRLKIPARSSTLNTRASTEFADNEGNVGDEEVVEEIEEINGVRVIGTDSYDEDEDEDVHEHDVSGDDDDEDDEDDGGGERYEGRVGDGWVERPQKKRKLKDSISNYEFAPRARTPSVQIGVQSQPSSVGQDIVPSWSDHETFALLDAWGERFLQHGRKSLRSEEWQEVAEKVSQVTDIERTDVQCRRKLDSLKKKYMKEKTKSATGGGGGGKWDFFRKLDMLLSTPSQRPSSLSCGIDSGEYVFMNPKVYLNRANGLDEMRDSPGNSESSKDEEDALPSKGKKHKAKRVGTGSFDLLADSIQKFSDIYENIENDKRKQMAELENMRMDIQRQIETQRRQILEKAQAEILKIRHGGCDGNDPSQKTSADDDLVT